MSKIDELERRLAKLEVKTDVHFEIVSGNNSKTITAFIALLVQEEIIKPERAKKALELFSLCLEGFPSELAHSAIDDKEFSPFGYITALLHARDEEYSEEKKRSYEIALEFDKSLRNLLSERLLLLP